MVKPRLSGPLIRGNVPLDIYSRSQQDRTDDRMYGLTRFQNTQNEVNGHVLKARSINTWAWLVSGILRNGTILAVQIKTWYKWRACSHRVRQHKLMLALINAVLMTVPGQVFSEIKRWIMIIIIVITDSINNNNNYLAHHEMG